MAGIRLFGQRKGAGAASGGDAGALRAEDIAAAWEQLSHASTSTTWTCRHSGDVILAEGSADFTAQLSQAAVILGKGKPLSYVYEGSTTYRAVDEEETEWETFRKVDPCGQHAYTTLDVLALAARAAGNVQVGKPAEVDGAMLRRHSVTLKPKPADPDKKVARLARQLRDHGATILVLSAYTDEEGEIVRLRYELPHWTPADAPTDDHAVVLELFDLATPVEITVPEKAGQRLGRRSCVDLNLF
jgi:hypothetical protein